MPARDTHCSFCGTKHVELTKYPRTCPACSTPVWSNPTPVSVVLLPVQHASGEGLLVVRRSIEPKKGLLALTGGFLESHETVEQGGAREVREETGVVIEPSTLSNFWFTSTRPRPGQVLLFSLAAPIPASALGEFKPSNETSERGLVFGPEGLETVFAFDLHVEAARRFFHARGVRSEHRFSAV